MRKKGASALTDEELISVILGMGTGPDRDATRLEQSAGPRMRPLGVPRRQSHQEGLVLEDHGDVTALTPVPTTAACCGA